MPTNVQSLAVRLNDGEGRFEQASVVATPFAPSAVVKIECGDLDGDGDLDAILYLSALFEHTYYVAATNDGTGAFTISSLRVIPILFSLFKLTDLDLDGDLDMVVSSSYGATPIQGFVNDGSNTFTPSTLLPASSGTEHGDVPALGDLNNDGRDDIVALWTGRYVYLSTPTGYVESVQPVLQTLNPLVECIADFNGDGNMDVLVATVGGTNALLLGDGTGALTQAPTPFMTTGTLTTLTPVDIDNDG
ncbi:MAG: FG-GAP repeat domain-containing protein, partial [Myxococcota bacterium]